MIILNIFTEFEYFGTYRTFEDTRGIKIKMLKDRSNHYKNTQNLLLY